MDGRLEQVFRLIDSAPVGEEFTSYVPSLERQLFRGFEPADLGRRLQTIEGGKASMSAAPISITADEVAKGQSLFGIDESLEALVEAAEQEAQANNGEI